MQVNPTILLRRDFATGTQAEAYRFFQQREAEQRKQRDRDQDMEKDVADLADLAVATITEAQTRELRLQIDRYDTATVNALYENEQALERVQAQIDMMFAQAYVLPDGRRVFKTEDGQQVFDEHGEELDPSFIDPDMIEDWRPRWEPVKQSLDQREALVEERTGLIAYQDKLDNARERLEAGDMTQAEYDRLREDLVEEMPDAVRRQIPELASEDLETTQAVAAADIDLGITDDMVATTAGPRAPIPGA